jgi:hypothetical protein
MEEGGSADYMRDGRYLDFLDDSSEIWSSSCVSGWW